MDNIMLRRNFKSVFANHYGYPGLSSVLKVIGIFRHYDSFRQHFTCTLKEDEDLYDALNLEISKIYNGEMDSCCIAPRVTHTDIYVARVNECWKRVRLDEINYTRNKCVIEAIDDGQLFTVDRNDIFTLHPKLLSNQFRRPLCVRFVLPLKRSSLSIAGFSDGQVRSGQLVNIFVLSDQEPFLALFTEGLRIKADKLTDDLDPGSARLWLIIFIAKLLTYVIILISTHVGNLQQPTRATTLSCESVRCRGVAYGSYTTANLPCDVWCDVTVVAFESLEEVKERRKLLKILRICDEERALLDKQKIYDKRFSEQSIRLMYLEELLDSVYGSEGIRVRLAFETELHITEGLACVTWDALNAVLIYALVDSISNAARWLRARITCISGDRSVVDVTAVDYPSVTLRGVNFRNGEIYMLRTDLLFPPLCCSIRAIDTNGKLGSIAHFTIAKEVLQIGAHVRVFSPSSSTLSVIELASGVKLEEYIEHAVEVDYVRRSRFNQNYGLETTNAVGSLLFVVSVCSLETERPCYSKNRGLYSDMVSFSSSMGSFPRTVLPHERHFESFSQSLSLGSQRRPLRCGVSVLQSLKRRSMDAFAKPCASHLNPVPSSSITPALSYSSSHSQFKMPNIYLHSSQRKLVDSSRLFLPVDKHKQKQSDLPCASSESDYLNKTLMSCESESDNETFGRSVNRNQLKDSSLATVRPSPPLCNSDSYSENSDLLRREAEIDPETKKQYEALRKELSRCGNSNLSLVSGTWCCENEYYLFWCTDNCCWMRVKIVAREDDDWKILCVDTGEEKFVKYNSLFFRLPKQFTINEWPPTCIGPLRLLGRMDARWLGIGARVFLRSLCEYSRSLTAVFGKGDSDRSVILYDELGRCLNENFLKFIESEANTMQ
ncbi:unnamed protein product [Thelazia callipaeda]|uniref:Tudor domain-containing protein n=1 Tax=Thelazia callipaeda TaxID=103827 RepID=A0A0N5CKT2_THECL|nr:unnamed protein product [Thelazia callipaeda]